MANDEDWLNFIKDNNIIPLNKKYSNIFIKNHKRQAIVRPREIELDYVKDQNFSPLLIGDKRNIDYKTIKSMDGGKIPIDASIDLHFNTVEKALDLLYNFICRSYNSGFRMLLVITGKGTGGKEGKIKQNLPDWLNMPTIRPMILRFNCANRKHGEEGAFYILLRRKRCG